MATNKNSQIVMIGLFDSAFEKRIQEQLNEGYKIISVTAQHVSASAVGTSTYNSIKLQGNALVVLEKEVNNDAWG